MYLDLRNPLLCNIPKYINHAINTYTSILRTDWALGREGWNMYMTVISKLSTNILDMYVVIVTAEADLIL